MPKSRPDKRVDRKLRRMRNIAIAFVAAVAVIIAVAGLYYGTGISTPSEFAEGTHYQLVSEDRPDADAPIRVIEFFSYGCVHCKNFEPMVERWERGLPDDVVLERVPVSFSPEWRTLAQTYYALEQHGALERNHQRIFNAIHDQNRNLMRADAVADFVDGRDIDRQTFLDTYNSADVRRAVVNAERMARDFGITGVPSMLVDDRFLVLSRNLTRPQVLAVVDHLVDKARDERTSPD